MPISDEGDIVIGSTLTDCVKIVGPFELGEVSFHLGWIFHGAGLYTTDTLCSVMTIIHIDSDMVVGEPRNESQGHDLKGPLNPVVWSGAY